MPLFWFTNHRAERALEEIESHKNEVRKKIEIPYNAITHSEQRTIGEFYRKTKARNYNKPLALIFTSEIYHCARIMERTIFSILLLLFNTVDSPCLNFLFQRLKYILDLTNYIELAIYACALIYVVPYNMCQYHYAPQVAAVSLFLGWLNLILYFRRYWLL